jgi:integrase
MIYSEVLSEWFEHHMVEIEESTAYNYKKTLPYIKDALGGLEVEEITEHIIYEYVQSLLHSTLAYSSTRVYCKVIKLSLRYAVRRGYLKFNPSDDVKMPKKIRAEIKVFQKEEIPLILSVDGPDWVKNGIVIAFRTGMRPSEIFALEWNDINFQVGFISVQRAISRANSKTKITKTPSGVRRIDIDTILIQYLHSLYCKRNPYNKYVFPAPPRSKRDYRVPWNISNELHAMCDKAGIEYRNFYALRHTHATLLLEMNVHPKIVQERLGHSDIKITMEIYSHVTPTIQQQAVTAMETIAM